MSLQTKSSSRINLQKKLLSTCWTLHSAIYKEGEGSMKTVEEKLLSTCWTLPSAIYKEGEGSMKTVEE